MTMQRIMNTVLLLYLLLLLLESAGRLNFIISSVMLWLSRLTNGILSLLFSLPSFHAEAGPGPGDKDKVMKLGFCVVLAFAGGVSVKLKLLIGPD